jgi:hypothetical protein
MGERKSQYGEGFALATEKKRRKEEGIHSMERSVVLG